ncbi:hypothetical protein F4809DRAFT_633108 [Biscogniauxia mediterranea]|nr:hypothetical protein F4809DRAFT_633108 [Biscogniauxia mediterranea]
MDLFLTKTPHVKGTGGKRREGSAFGPHFCYLFLFSLSAATPFCTRLIYEYLDGPFACLPYIHRKALSGKPGAMGLPRRI